MATRDKAERDGADQAAREPSRALTLVGRPAEGLLARVARSVAHPLAWEPNPSRSLVRRGR